MCNASFRQGMLPPSQRHVIIMPRIKKPNADPTDVKNYRPISNLTFKFCIQTNWETGLSTTNGFPWAGKFPSGSSVGVSLDRDSHLENCLQCPACSRLWWDHIALSAAFDTVDQDILIERLHTSFSVRGSALALINSFICNRTQTVVLNGQKWTRSALDCGFPQESVLGPILFLLCTANVTAIAERYEHGWTFLCRWHSTVCTF